MGKRRVSVRQPHFLQTLTPGWLAVFVGIVAFVCYLPTLGSGFVYDAQAQILIDDYIHQPANLVKTLTLQVLGMDELDANRPVQLFSLQVDSLIWGKRAFGYHLTSNLLHAANTALVFLLILGLLPSPETVQSRIGALLGALVFAVHPVNVEAVAEVACREDLLACFFILTGLAAARKFGQVSGRAGVIWGAVSVLSFFLAVGAKETGVAGPVLLALYAVLVRPPGSGRRWLVLAGAAALAVGAFLAARFFLAVEHSEIFHHPPQRIGSFWTILFVIQPRLWAFLVMAVAWPARLSADYAPANLAWLSLPWAWVILAVVVLIQAGLAWKSRPALFGAALFWLGLAPVSNFLPMYRPLADRFLYLPMAGVALTLAAVLSLLAARKWLWGTLVAVIVGWAAILTVWNVQRQNVFANSVNLWRDTSEKAPFSVTAFNNLGYAYYEISDFPAALSAFERALKLTEGKYADTWSGAALVFEKSGRPAEAQEALQRAISLDARYSDPDGLTKVLVIKAEDAEVLKQILRRTHTP